MAGIGTWECWCWGREGSEDEASHGASRRGTEEAREERGAHPEKEKGNYKWMGYITRNLYNSSLFTAIRNYLEGRLEKV